VITIRPPGDKSISHRAVLLSAVADGPSHIEGLCDGDDVRSSLSVIEKLGAQIEVTPEGHGLRASVRPRNQAAAPQEVLECGNSGTTARLAAGLLVGLGVGAVLDGDASLRARPMRRVVYPLQAMGAKIDYLDERNRLPVAIRPRATGSLRSLKHRPRVASAQVKSAILLAGVLDGVPVEVHEPVRSRDHTERLLAGLGVPVECAEGEAGSVAVAFDPGVWSGSIRPLDMTIPGDPSSAAFMIAAALLMRRPIRIEGVSDNPTRTGFLSVLEEMGATVERGDSESRCGEPVSAWTVRPPDRLRAFEIGGTAIPGVIDEIPILAILAARGVGRSVIRDAAELRVKESDRIDRLSRNLAALGVTVSERDDGLEVEGTTARLTGAISAAGDHRIAMAFGVLGETPAATLELDDPECARVSYPDFREHLRRVTEPIGHD
jgi:3-phosphoshikimate 1-carboxyvinyltransferase